MDHEQVAAPFSALPPREGIDCECAAHDGLHMHINDTVLPIVLDDRIPRGTMLIGPPNMLSVDEPLIAAWGRKPEEFDRP